MSSGSTTSSLAPDALHEGDQALWLQSCRALKGCFNGWQDNHLITRQYLIQVSEGNDGLQAANISHLSGSSPSGRTTSSLTSTTRSYSTSGTWISRSKMRGRACG